MTIQLPDGHYTITVPQYGVVVRDQFLSQVEIHPSGLLSCHVDDLGAQGDHWMVGPYVLQKLHEASDELDSSSAPAASGKVASGGG